MVNLQTKSYPALRGFTGINTGVSPFNIEDSQATDMLNITSDDYPAITQRKEDIPAFADEETTFDKIYYMGVFFDNTVFIIATEATASDKAIYYWALDSTETSYKKYKWYYISLQPAETAALNGAEKFDSTNFDDMRTVIAFGGVYSTSVSKLFTVTKPISGYSVSLAPETDVGEGEQDSSPEYVDFVRTKSERLMTASSKTNVLGNSEYQRVRFIAADDIDFIYMRTEENDFATGLAVYGDYTLYFKRHSTHIVYGANVDSFTPDILSRQIGCISHRTIAETNAGLMWLGADGVYAYSATTLPYRISDPVKKYIDNMVEGSAAASDGEKYYLSLRQAGGGWVMLVFDTVHKAWYVWENRGYTQFLKLDDTLYATDGTRFYELSAVQNSGTWKFVTKPFDLANVSGFNNIYRMYVNVRADKNSTLKIGLSASVDADDFKEVYTDSFVLPKDGKLQVNIPPSTETRKLEHFRIKLEGTGNVGIYGLEVHLRARGRTY